MIFMSERKDILVTGCCGGMGSAICKKLIEQNYRVFGIDKSITTESSENFILFECEYQPKVGSFLDKYMVL